MSTSALLEGVKAREDLPLALDIVAKLESARTRILELEQVWIELPDRDSRSPAVVAAAKAALAGERKPDVDDFARGQLVTVLADVGMTSEALAATGRIANAWERAHGEAETAVAVALVDRKAAVALARRALDRAATPGHRTDVVNDTSEISAPRAHPAGSMRASRRAWRRGRARARARGATTR